LVSNQIRSQNFDFAFTVRDTFKVNLDNSYNLSALSVIPFSDTVYLKHKRLKRITDYSVDYPRATLHLSRKLQYSLLDTLIIVYKSYRIPLKRKYLRHKLVYRFNEKTQETVRVSKQIGNPLSAESIFGNRIQKSGTIVRGFQFGTNKDFSLSSGLRLQLSGKLSNEIEIVAALTDKNTPIQPEGNSETLDELDKVFIEIKHPNAIGTFGDYDFIENTGEFGKINRKLQGLKAQVIFKNFNGKAAFASSRGKFNSVFITGIDGVQGPYRLSGVNNERNIIIIAGSERVFVDGKELKRGENNDYTIEYGNAEITFTPKVLITSASRINIDFEYTDRKFERNFFGGSVATGLFNKKLNVKVNYAQEGDDKNNTIDISLSGDDKKILQEAGDNINLATRSGISLAKPDSLGNVKGIYTKIDTMINGKPFSYYVYNPGSVNSKYNVRFSFVGNNKGDYIKENLGEFKFVGVGKGSYLPVIFLPLPQLKQTANILIESNPIKNLNLSLEFAGSSFDKNRFSNKDDADNNGIARNFKIHFNKEKLVIGSLNLGKIDVSYRDRFVQDRFTALDRFNDVEFDREYNTNSSVKSNEVLREFVFGFKPVNTLNIFTKYGYLKKGNLKSKRYIGKFNFNDEDKYNVNFNYDLVNSENSLIKTDWVRQTGSASVRIFNLIKPGIDYLFENKNDQVSGKNSLINTSLKYSELAPFIQLLNYKNLSLTVKYSWRTEYFPINGILQKESLARLQTYLMNYKSKHFYSDLNLTFRNKNITKAFKALGKANNETVLLRSVSRLNLFNRFLDVNFYYQAATEKTAKLEKVFVRVPQGSGNYKYLGDLNNNGVADENEFEQTIFDGDFIITTIPSDELFPVINLKTNFRLKLNFSKIVKTGNLFGFLLKPVSTETSVRIDEKSKERDTKKIYLLNFKHFLNDSTTINGFNTFQHDVFLFKNSNTLSFRFRYLQRKSLNQFSAGLEKAYFRERSARVDFRLVKEIRNRTEFINQIDNVLATSVSNRSRLVTNNFITTDFSYRPVQNIEVGFKIKSGRIEDNFPKTPTIIDQNSQTIRFTLAFASKGRLRIEAERNELTPNTSSNNIPFEILRGNTTGKNYRWQINFDYRVAANLQTTLNYDGRLQGSGKVINTMRAEARAFF